MLRSNLFYFFKTIKPRVLIMNTLQAYLLNWFDAAWYCIDADTSKIMHATVDSSFTLDVV